MAFNKVNFITSKDLGLKEDIKASLQTFSRNKKKKERVAYSNLKALL